MQKPNFGETVDQILKRDTRYDRDAYYFVREGLDVTTVLFANRKYAILQVELARVGANSGPKAMNMLQLDRPDLDWVSLAKGMGVPGERVTTAAEFNRAFGRGLATPGPYLIEAALG